MDFTSLKFEHAFGSVHVAQSTLDEKIKEYVNDAYNGGYPNTPTIGAEYLIEHIDTELFESRIEDFIKEELVQYIADATCDAEITLGIS